MLKHTIIGLILASCLAANTVASAQCPGGQCTQFSGTQFSGVSLFRPRTRMTMKYRGDVGSPAPSFSFNAAGMAFSENYLAPAAGCYSSSFSSGAYSFPQSFYAAPGASQVVYSIAPPSRVVYLTPAPPRIVYSIVTPAEVRTVDLPEAPADDPPAMQPAPPKPRAHAPAPARKTPRKTPTATQDRTDPKIILAMPTIRRIIIKGP